MEFQARISGPETDTISIYWAQLSRLHLKTETELSPKICFLNIKQDLA
jgi:hypothetical protein